MQSVIKLRLFGAAGLTAVLAAGVSGLVPSASAAPTSAAAAGDQAMTWSLAEDMGRDPSGNPIADSYGNTDVWSWRSGTDGPGSRLDDQLGNDCGSDQYFVHTSSQSQGLPLVSYNASDDPLSCFDTVTIPAHSVDVHPSTSEDAVVAWTSPIDGTVSVSGAVSDNDANGGNGITYDLVDGAMSLASGEYENGGSATFDAGGDVTVAKGDTLYLLVGNRGEYTYDSTRVDLTITDTTTPPEVTPPTLLVTAPTSIKQGQTRTVRLYGTDFADGAVASLDDESGLTLGEQKRSTRTTSKGGMQDVIAVPVTAGSGAAATLRQWKVTNPDGGVSSCTKRACKLAVVAQTPKVTSVDPSSVERGTTTTVALTGTGFADDLQVAVSGPGVTVSNVVVQDSQHASFELGVDLSAKTGGRTLKVSNPGAGSSSKKGAIRITAAQG